ncbi:gliding motility-associated C-terminal domain-containing protein [Mucilaginibacter arboris]|uniref:PKD domain-containing protein n=1 Tax=Mucilaginibacter arboris TaxID=2682090 RepID=A0A7K1SX86_9SPHI|nr:gliding motility-associated C-terminal domain-containing protein [Mucilaginibacter arboris]MVN21939.1 PKD domain-containing protein [Mucilaginibacter arboris]
MTKKITLRIFSLCLLLFFACPVFSQTNKGTEFWTAYMDNVRGVVGNNTCQMSLYLTSDVSTSGTITVADGSYSQGFTVTANQVTTVTMPQSAFLATEGQFLKGIHITAADPIVVYAHIYASAVSGATLLLPVSTLAKDYYSINYTQRSNEGNSYSSFAVVATEDTTTVEITPTATLNSGRPAGTPFTITLQKGELYQGLSLTDLTGTRIRSVSSGTNVCKKIAVFSGSSKIYIGTPNMSADNLFQQVYPTASWGRNYITAPLSNRPYDTYRIVISDPTTQVTLNGSVLSNASFTNGFYYEFNSTVPNVISADKPVQVVQYAVTQGNSLSGVNVKGDVGDPEMIYLNPIEQSVNNVTLYSPTAYKILQSYINVIIAASAASSFTLDGTAPTGGFKTVPGNSSYSYGQFAVSSGTHNIQASTGFNAIAYGFGNAESYGYSAGTNLKNLNEFVQIKNSAGDTLASACVGQDVKLEVTLPYQTTRLIWRPQNSVDSFAVDNPVLTAQTVKDNKTLYTYAYPKAVAYSKAGTYDVKVKAFNAIADACGSYEDIDLSFTVYDNPVAAFTAKAQTCQSDSLTFTDKSMPTGAIIKNWAWNFGDGGTSTSQNPTHVYNKAGDFIATLLVTNSNGCTSALDSQKVHIYAKPVSKFSVSNPDCATKTITFTDQSTSAEGNIVQWNWDFGDGTTQTLTAKTPFQHIFKAAGNYKVQLITISDLGCRSDALIIPVVIHPLPVPNFTLPEICISDAYADFTDKSSIADHTESGFTYSWNFGDPAANAANPNTSTQKNPQHKYMAAADYQVKLTVTSQDGCSADTTFKFTVNGAVPKADFTVLNPASLCSKQAVLFRNTSTLDFGNLTKIVMYYDFTNHPDQSETDDDPAADKLYSHQYPVFNTPATVNYTVLMRTYSGLTCVDEKMQVITLKANPEVALALPSRTCLEVMPFQVAATELHGYQGTGTFSGKGISSSGLFNPAAAGVGTQSISYMFTADNGCADTVTKQITVNPTPTVNAGKDIFLLEGAGGVTLNPIVSGTNLTFKWTPSAGLSHDNILRPVASPLVNTTYKLTVTSADSCTNADEITVSVLKAPVIPNTFTPNNDGINDIWNIKYLDSYPDVIVEVFNRYGERIYYSKGYAVPWDGRYKGTELPVGTYYYIINPGLGRSTIAGPITIIR